MKPTRRTLLIIVAVAFASVVAVRIIARLTQRNAELAADDHALVIRAEKVTKGEIVHQITVSGTIRPNNEVEIYPKLSGRLIALNANVGDNVEVGDVLAVIEHEEILLQEKSARASLAMAKTNENAARKDLERGRELFLERAMAKAELEAIEQKFDVAKAQALSALAQAEISTQQLRNAKITSLIRGTITKRTTALGANVSPHVPIFLVQDMSKLKLVTSVDAATLVRLKKGIETTFVVSQLEKPITGRVVSIAPSLDAQSRRAEIEIELEDHSGHLVPNMFIDGSLQLERITNALVVPNRALVTTGSSAQVFRVIDGKIVVVKPNLGYRDNSHSQIIDGLAEGDLIAVSGLDRLRDGVLVSVEGAK